MGADRVLFGSDAAVDGPTHFVRSPPNIEGSENYNQSLLRLARELPPDTVRALLEGNTRRLFRLAAPPLPVAAPEAPEAIRDLFAAALSMAAEVIAGVRPEDLGRATPCAGWDVRTVLGHLVSTARQAERVARGARASVPAVVRLERRDRWGATFTAAAGKARTAWADGAETDGVGPPVQVPWGLVPAPVALSGFVLELVAHTHDVAVGIGRPEPLDERLGAAALRIAERLLPADLRGDGTAFAGPVPVPVDRRRLHPSGRVPRPGLIGRRQPRSRSAVARCRSVAWTAPVTTAVAMAVNGVPVRRAWVRRSANAVATSVPA